MNLQNYIGKAPLTIDEVKAVLANHKNGQILTIVYRSSKRTSKKTGEQLLEKYSVFQAQFGCDYYHTPEGREALERNGCKNERNGLQTLVNHTLYLNKEGEEILAVYPLSNGYGEKLFVLNGDIKTVAELSVILPPSMYSGSHYQESGTRNLFLKNILYIA